MFDDWVNQAIPEPDAEARQQALRHQRNLTKPPGSLGRLESLAVQLAGMQGRAKPDLKCIRVVVFAADHGVYAEGIAPYPQQVTVEMIRNFSAGGAAISVLARQLDATLEVVNVGTVGDPGPLPGVVDARISAGTRNLSVEPAMNSVELRRALLVGRAAIERAAGGGCQLVIAGEMGIANTTAASALGCALMGEAPEHLVGPGTGLDAEGIRRKSMVVARALALHGDLMNEPMGALRRLGGLEISALVGCYIRAAQSRLPVLIDGFIATVAALAAVRIRPEIQQWLIFGHRSTEAGHARVLDALDADPILDLGMRLGEGSGAATAALILRAAINLHGGMATFDSAGVSTS